MADYFDPFEAAKSELAAGTSGDSTPTSPNEDDPFEMAKKELAEHHKAIESVDQSTGAKIGAGVQQGLRDVALATAPIAQKIENLTGPITFGGTIPTVAQTRQNNLVGGKEFEQNYPDSSIAAGGRVGGQLIGTLPLLASGGAVTGAVGEALPAIGELAEANLLTRFGTRAASGAAQGAGFNTLTQNDPQQGAVAGGLINAVGGPVIGKGAGYATELTQPFFASGREKIANKILQGFGGEGPLNINANEIVQGSKPTMAEATGNAGLAQLQDTLRDVNSKPFFDREFANAEARNNALAEAAGTPQDIEAATAQRAARAEQALGNPEKGIPSELFATAKPVQTEALQTKIDEILAGKSGNRPSVVQSMNAVKNMLHDENGSPITDPETLYHSVRKGIGDLLDKKNLTNPAGQQAAAELGAVRDALDETIEQGAPGFKKYLNDYSSASGPVNAMQWMQNLNLRDAQGNITLPKVQNALNNVKKMQNTPGINDAKHLSQEQVATLQNLRDDLLRKQNLSAGKSYGSPTIQKASAQNKLNNILNNSNHQTMTARLPAEATGAGIGAAAGATIGMPIIGSMAGAKAGQMISKGLANKNDLIRQRLQEIMLNPNSYIPPTSEDSANALLNNPLLHYGGIPIGVAGTNQLIK